MSRNHQPCRVCGSAHTNRMSSNICPECGESERWRNTERAAEEQVARLDALDAAASLDDLKAWLREHVA